ncbi:MAG: Uncharacterised protein [Acidimicrobiales bacterium AG-410-I20]|nr:MAG: Uncharacterised protein [Acidimicrobiales bacterium AG-410-I20]
MQPKVKNDEAIIPNGSRSLIEATKKKAALPKKSHHDAISVL